ncbi:MAG: polyprenyl synthetase family protein [Gammaproteobacteria bacterium]|nr:polyprenyl synthetase family protein [Gammaproteobacteria bacterium]
MTLNQIRALVADDLAVVDRLLSTQSRSEIDLANQVARYIVEAGGKRIRAVLVLLCGRALGGLRHPDASFTLAAVIEFIHTATLLHDDVIDDSEIRRGRATANKVWGNEASVLGGDFFYSRAFGMISEIDRSEVTRILANAANAIVEGELLELMHARQIELDEDQYLTIIEGKTAKLFEASCEAAARIEGADDEHTQELAHFGRLLGAAFQIADDAIDYLEDNPEADKSVGDDLAGGRLTLPYIYALREAPKEDREFLHHTIQSGQREHIGEVCAIMHRSGAIDYAWKRAREFAQRAQSHLNVLDASSWRDALEGVTEFSVSRRY